MSFFNQQAESWALGALLDAESRVVRSTAAQLLDASGLTAEDFTQPVLRTYFTALRSVVERGRPADPQTVYSACRGLTGVTEKSLEVLRGLQGGNTANRETFIAHCEDLRRLTLLRRLTMFHADQLEALEAQRPDPKALATAIETFAQSFAASSQQDETGDSDITDLLDDWDAFTNDKRQPYLPTGIEVLDAEIGGFVPNLNVIGGMESVGKSALIAEIIFACLGRGMRVGLFGLEDATKWITKRQLAKRMGMPVGQIAASRLDKDGQERLSEAAGEIHNLTRNLQVYRRAGIDPATLVQQCKHWVLNKGVRAIFIDHGGEVQHESSTARDRHDLAVANTYRQLRDLAVNHQVPVIVLCHFNRDTDKVQNGVPRMHNFAESHYIARMARVALGLWAKDGDRRLRCTVLKRTEGERNITVAIERDEACALVKRRGGEVLDLRAEAEREQPKQRPLRPAHRSEHANGS